MRSDEANQEQLSRRRGRLPSTRRVGAPPEMTGGLPHGEQAILDIGKLEDCCLSLAHPRGRHKARVFRAALGIGQAEAAWLRDILLQAVRANEGLPMSIDTWGEQQRIDVGVERHGKTAAVKTIWILRTGEIAARFVTCWVF